MAVSGRGDELVEFICGPGRTADEVDSAKMQLLSELFAGYPLRQVGRLLRSESSPAVRAGAWLLSELGERAAPRLDEVPRLLGDRERVVRFFAIDAVIAASSADDGVLIAGAIRLIDDDELAVRKKAMQLLAAIPVANLRSARTNLGNGPIGALTDWLIQGADGRVDVSDVLAGLDDPVPTTRRFAAALARRMVDRDPSPLGRAATVSDPDISSFASFELSLR